MKKFLLLFCISILSFSGAQSQVWSATLKSIDGLPGEANAYYGELYYTFNSKVFTPGGTLDIIRLTVVETYSNEKPNGNSAIFALSELTVYDGDGNEVPYTASSNADHNSLSWQQDGGGLAALNDNNIKSYFHSMYSTPAVSDYHYIELVLSRKVSSFSLEWTTRVGEEKNDPTVVGITLGTQYTPTTNSAEMYLGSAVATESELAEEGQFFVLKGNAYKSYYATNGATYTGSGPIYMQYAEIGDTKASQMHVMQLIPYKDGKYLIYWPQSGRFIKDSCEDYNGLNGWQYSTLNLEEAAPVSITSIDDGFFEIHYESTYDNQPITFYIGAEMRDNVNSKMKIFTPEHKQYLENGDYTKGYSLPIAFNWSIYKANIESSAVNALTMQQISEKKLGSTITKATSYLGSYDKYCKNNENILLDNKIAETSAFLNLTSITFEDIDKQKEELLAALSRYIATKLDYYSEQVSTILANAVYSTYPNYIKDTYPASSKSILESIQTSIANAKKNSYTVEEYEALYSQIQRDIELFENTKITETTIPEEEEKEEDITEEDVICVYLANGDVDIYGLSTIDGEYYVENNKLYLPLSNGDVIYYTKEEYDSCSSIKPAMPTMTSFKFNNKYNPNLHVDAVADTVTNSMTFNLNAIGKWLTASFTLSDDKAVAYVDTVPQVSKVTRQSFKNSVIYNVTYPGYNIIRNIKTQDEIWSEVITSTEITEVPLTAEMLYTNKPSTQQNESLANLLDNSANTIFHSTWGSANNATVNVNTYITIDLPEALNKIQIYYQCRPQQGYNPLVWEIYASNDGNTWNLVRTLDYTVDNMPTGGYGQTFTSSTIDLQGEYSKLKIVQTRGEYSKNHFAISELRINKVVEKTTGEAEKIQDAKYETRRIPYGNKYAVKVNWLTDIPNSVPRIDIDVDGGYYITSKDYYRKAKFRITGYGIYDNFEDSVQIKGRGNTSWYQDKKPYRLKFAEKVKPFGLTKGKSWVLLANAQAGSLMANAISMKIGQMAKAEYTNHIVPIELYMNGQYMGSYMFTEKVGLANNSVDIDEDMGYLLELDTYYDETYKFKTDYYSLPVNIKEPDLSEYPTGTANLRNTKIKQQMNAFCEAVSKGEDIDNMLDMDAFARFMLANDLSLNQEIGHPKSTFLFKEDENNEDAKLKFGPIWDFDWGFGYEDGGSKYCYSQTNANVFKTTFEAYTFFRDLTLYTSFKKQYYKVWKEFIENNSMDELIDYIDSYYAFAESSFSNNASYWGRSYGFSESDKERFKSWLKERKNYIYENLDKYDITDIIYAITGDVNCNNQVTILDAALITAYLNGNIHASFNNVKADCDKNGVIDSDDACMAATIIQEGEAPSATYWHSTPQAIGEFYSDNVVLTVGDIQNTTLNLLSYNEEKYKALQFDITMPEGVSLIDIISSEAISEHNFSYAEKGNNTYRITAYSDKDECMPTSKESLIELIVSSTEIINEDNRAIKISNAYIVDSENNELKMGEYEIRFSQAAGIDYNGAESLVEGGECITITLLEPQDIDIYSVDGRKIRSINAKKGTTRVVVPAGIYIVNGEKVIVQQ